MPCIASAQSVQDAFVQSDDTVDCPCLRSTVRFDVSSVEKIILQPEKILEDPGRFWQQDEAYQLVRKWHDRTNQPLDLDGWRQGIEAIRDLTLLEREIHPQLVAARGLADVGPSFASRAVPYLCEFLPPEADLSTRIYFTTDIMAAGFQESGHIVIHILNHELLNLFVHELFHRGYATTYRRSGNPQPETDPIRLMYLALQNEGLATYVAYRGMTEFPEIGQVGRSLVAGDYDMLSKPGEVARLHAGLGQLFGEAGQLNPDELRTRSWQVGVRERAYYVVGAHMAQVIDQELGRPALIETIRKGPSSFVETYNSLVEDSQKIPEI